MKRVFLFMSLFMACAVTFAVPAKRGVWKTIRLADGSETRVQLTGDEFRHYWQAGNGLRYVGTNEGFIVEPLASVSEANSRRTDAQQRRASRLQAANSRRAAGHRAAYTGEKKGLILLVNFKDVKFKSGHDNALFTKIANTKGYADGDFVGSVADYFEDQSLGQFKLTFDVVGPVTVSKNAKYYGENDDEGNDNHPGDMVKEALNLVKNEISDWSQYDWDGNKEIDQVMVIYAGEGEASGGSDNTIWPHEWALSSATGSRLSLGSGYYANTYAVANEVDVDDDNNYHLTGIGTICHEFSHCLGLPDMYDTSYSGFYGMSTWSLMDAGSYNGDGFVPSNFTAYDKMSLGWVTATELTEPTAVTDLKPTADGGKVYRITNGGNANEYYLIENRQQKGWDKYVPAPGMLVLHVDYDEEIWYANLVNCANSDPNEGPLNDHQRCTIFHADGVEKNLYYSEMIDDAINRYYAGDDSAVDDYYEYYDLYYADMANDVYPQPDNDKLTNTSTPRAFTYNKNTDGRLLMNVAITEIKQNGGLISFNFAPDNAGTEEGDNTDYGQGSSVTPTVDYLFYETFDDCAGTGGNDNKWNGSVGSGTLSADYDGWTFGSSSYGADKCIRVGKSNERGSATTPAIPISGTATLTFRAGGWDATGDLTKLKLTVSAGTISPASVTLTKGAWKDFTATITATGSVKVTFAADGTGITGRFFLDEVKVVDPTTTAIEKLDRTVVNDAKAAIYTLDGRRVSSDIDRLPRGIYIKAGKKFVK